MTAVKRGTESPKMYESATSWLTSAHASSFFFIPDKVVSVPTRGDDKLVCLTLNSSLSGCRGATPFALPQTLFRFIRFSSDRTA